MSDRHRSRFAARQAGLACLAVLGQIGLLLLYWLFLLTVNQTGRDGPIGLVILPQQHFDSNGRCPPWTPWTMVVSTTGSTRGKGGKFLPTFSPLTGPLGTRVSPRNSQNFFLLARDGARSRADDLRELKPHVHPLAVAAIDLSKTAAKFR